MIKVVRTPLLRFDDGIVLKPENLQPFGSYKIRGVLEAMRVARPEVLRQGISAASAGNMAQAVAFCARESGYGCTIYVPESAPEIKKAPIRSLDAKLIELPFLQVWDLVRSPPIEEPGLFFHPVRTPGLLEGYGTIADEIILESPETTAEPTALIVPFGVGGLTLGLARQLKKHRSKIQIYAVEPETAAPFAASLRAGRPTAVDRKPSFVDSIGTPEVLPYVFAEAKELGVQSLVVSLDEIQNALREVFVRSKLVVEGAAAAAVAGAIQISKRKEHQNAIAILTGGGISPATFKGLL